MPLKRLTHSCLGAIALLVLMLTILPSAKAQSAVQGRIYYFGQSALGENDKLSLGAGWHSTPADHWNRFELRSTYFYTANNWLKLAYGQRSNFAFSHGDFTNYEFRPFQSAYLYHPGLTDSQLTHRFMVEQRAFFNNDLNNQFSARLRYRFELNKPIGSINSFYVRPMSELFYTIDRDQVNSFSQWKSTLAIGYSMIDYLKVEFRYEYVLNKVIDEVADLSNRNGFRLQFIHSF